MTYKRERYNASKRPTWTPDDLRAEFDQVQRGIPHAECIDMRDFIRTTHGLHDEATNIARAFSQVPTTGARIRFPQGRFATSANLFAALTTNVPVAVEMVGAELYTSAPVVVPRECRVVGIGRANSRDSSISNRGGIIRAASDFPNDGTAVVRLGIAAAVAVFGIRLENIMVDGGGLSSVRGVYSTSLNEQCGLEHVTIYNVKDGIRIVAEDSGVPNNYELSDFEILLDADSAGIGVYVDHNAGSSNFLLRKGTVTHLTQTTVAGSVGYRFAGVNGGVGIGLHAEAVETGFSLGEVASRDANGLTLVGVTGYIAGMVDCVKIGTTGSVRDFTLVGATSNATNILNDAVNGITYVSATYPRLGFYAFGSLSGGSAARRLYSSIGGNRQALSYGATVNTDCSKGEYCTLTVSNTNAFTIANPTVAIDGQDLYYEIFNNSGGEMGAITWGGDFVYRDAGWQNPANGNRRVIHFKRRATSWAQVSVTADMNLPNSTFQSAQITSDQNDYATGGYRTLRLNTDASRNITGLAGGKHERELRIINVGAQNIVLQNENAGSTAANRIITGTGADITVAPDDVVNLWYDGTTARWRITNTH